MAEAPNASNGNFGQSLVLVWYTIRYDIWDQRPGSRKMFDAISGINPYKILENIWCQIRFQSGGEALIRLECQVGS